MQVNATVGGGLAHTGKVDGIDYNSPSGGGSLLALASRIEVSTSEVNVEPFTVDAADTLQSAFNWINSASITQATNIVYDLNAGLKQGANQAAAAAVAGELWVDTSDANTVKLGV